MFCVHMLIVPRETMNKYKCIDKEGFIVMAIIMDEEN